MEKRKKKEFRVFLNPPEAEWIEEKIERGEAATASEALRRIVENTRREEGSDQNRS